MRNAILAATIATTALLAASPEARSQNNDFQIVSADQNQYQTGQNQYQNGHQNRFHDDHRNHNHADNRNPFQNGHQSQNQNGNQDRPYVVSRVQLQNLVEPILLRSTPSGNVYKWVTYAYFQVTYSDGRVEYESNEISTSFVDPNQQQSQPRVVSRVPMRGFTERYYSHTSPTGEYVYKWVTFEVFQVTYSDGHTEREQNEVSTSWTDPNAHYRP